MGTPKVIKNGIFTKAEYDALHHWVIKHLGRPQQCWVCGTTEKRRYQWANVSQEYRRDLSDWQRMCVPCHKRFDSGSSYPITHCENGHEFTPENTLLIVTRPAARSCRECKNQWNRAHPERRR